MASYLSGFEHLEFQLEEIKTATNNFDDCNVIGTGGFGKVYKGELTLPEGKQMAAFKRLDRKHGQGDPEFFKEIRMLSSCKHDNLISLLGFCKEGDEMILIYEHASQGSLDRILNKATLTWTQRLKICLDAAKGLCFLHDPKGTQQRVLHCDIKSANILLDESLNAKVADFGLSKISPANQQFTLLVTSPVGTPGYCDPLYMYTYKLTKESDVYSFGVVLFEVLCGRVCYENSNGKLKIFVPYWKKCYEQKKLDEIIFPHLKQQMDPSSVEQFVDIAYQCLQETREERPTMSVVVEKLETALELQEQEPMRMAAEQEYKEILKCADPPLRFLEFLVNGGKTKSRKQRPTMSVVLEKLKAALKFQEQEEILKLLTIKDKGEVSCERIRIEACLDQIQYDRLEYPFCFENSRFPGGRWYCKHKDELKVRVRARFLCPLIRYSVNLVFRNSGTYMCKTLHYKLNGETKCCMVYDAYERDGWFVVPLYQFTSDHQFAQFEINFERFRMDLCKLHVAGFEFRPIEETVELHGQGLEEYHDIVKAASQSLVYKSPQQLKELLCIGFHINNHTTLLSINNKGKLICERIYIEACLDQIQYDRLEDPSDFENSRFPGGRCYCKHEEILKVRVRAQFLCPLITYSVNLVFRNTDRMTYSMTLHYKLNGETKCSMVYNTYKREDGWFVVPLYQFTSNHKIANFEIDFGGFRNGCKLQVAGFEFQPLEEKVELHDQGLEEYQDIVKAASQPLFYKSLEELKELLSIGFHIDNHKTWFSLNEIGEQCEMLSIANCLISRERGYSFCCTDLYSRFPRYYRTNQEGFKVHIRTQFLTPSIRYTVNLVIRKDNSSKKKKYVALRYKLKGETETSIVYLATTTKDNHSFIAELYQFTSTGRVFDLEIVFLDQLDDLEVEGILFQPFEKVEDEQVLEDEKLSNDSPQWRMKTDLFSNRLKTFNGQEGYAFDNNGKKSLMLSPRGAIRSDNLSFKSSPESRFREVTVITNNCFDIVKEIKPDVLSSETTYACYLVYKFTGDQLVKFNIDAIDETDLLEETLRPSVKFNIDAIDETDLLEETLRPSVEAFSGTMDIVSLSG
nr:protein kinase-like domain, phloem protein 2-like protein [Tanacetum cinerariifolium]